MSPSDSRFRGNDKGVYATASTQLTVLLATRNRQKAQELKRLLKGLPVRLLTLDRFPQIPPVKEDGATFRANAVKKAIATSGHTILPVLAEDSGLKVRALGGRPGVHSARFAIRQAQGEQAQSQVDRANNAKLLKMLRNVPPSRRRARFVCCMALSVGGRLIRIFEGTCAGSIAPRPAGRTGFGYDPLFIPRGYTQTMAQLGPRLKDRLSHRAKTVKKFGAWLKRYPVFVHNTMRNREL